MSLSEFFDNCENHCEPNDTTAFNWSAKGVGFGQFYFYIKNDKVHCENECMSKEFVKKMLCQMVDDCVLDDPREDEKS